MTFTPLSKINCHMKQLCCLFLIAGLLSCHSNKEDGSVQEGNPEAALPYSIKIEKPDCSSLEPLLLSEFADSVSYVQLETTSNCLLSAGTKQYIIDSLLFVTEIFSMHQFDAVSGKFLHRIGKVGQGPGEFLQANEAVDKENKIIYVKSPGTAKLLRYDYEGKYMGDLRFIDTEEFSFSNHFYSLRLLKIDSQYMVFHSELKPSKQALHPYELIIYDYKNNKIHHALPNQMGGTYKRSTYYLGGLMDSQRQQQRYPLLQILL